MSTSLVALPPAPKVVQTNIAAGIAGNYPAPMDSASTAQATADETFPPTKQPAKKFAADQSAPETMKPPSRRYLALHHSRPAEPLAAPSAPRPAASPADPPRCPRQK